MAVFPVEEIPGLNRIAAELADLVIHEIRFQGREIYPFLAVRRIWLCARNGSLLIDPEKLGGHFFLSPVLKRGLANYEEGYIDSPIPWELRLLGIFFHEWGHFFYRHPLLDPTRPLSNIRSENEAWGFAFDQLRLLETLGVQVDWKEVEQQRELSLGSYDMGFRFDPDALRWPLRDITTPRELFFSELYRNAAEELLGRNDFRSRVLKALEAFNGQWPTPSELLLTAIPSHIRNKWGILKRLLKAVPSDTRDKLYEVLLKLVSSDTRRKWRVLHSLWQFDEQVEAYVSKSLSE